MNIGKSNFIGVVELREIEVKFTQKFIDNFDKFKEDFENVFWKIESIDDYAKDVARLCEQSSYGYRDGSNQSVEAIGRPFIEVWNAKVYKPKDDGWEQIDEGEEPDCGLIIKRHRNEEVSFLCPDKNSLDKTVELCINTSEIDIEVISNE